MRETDYMSGIPKTSGLVSNTMILQHYPPSSAMCDPGFPSTTENKLFCLVISFVISLLRLHSALDGNNVSI